MLTLHFVRNPQNSPYHWSDLDLQPETVTRRLLETNHYVLEFNASIGANLFYHEYIVRRIAERFPELLTEAEVALDAMKKEFYMAKEELCERLEILSEAPLQTLERFYKQAPLRFMTIQPVKGRYWGQDVKSDKPLLTPVNLPRNVENYQPAPGMERDVLYALLASAVQGKTELSIAEYGQYMDKLNAATLLSNAKFTYYSEFLGYLEYEGCRKKSTCLCRMGFLRNNGQLQLFIDVPYRLRNYAKRVLTL